MSWIQTWVRITVQSLARLPHVLVEGQIGLAERVLGLLSLGP